MMIFLRTCAFFCCYFSRHISNLNFREDTVLNANSYVSFTNPPELFLSGKLLNNQLVAEDGKREQQLALYRQDKACYP